MNNYTHIISKNNERPYNLRPLIVFILLNSVYLLNEQSVRLSDVNRCCAVNSGTVSRGRGYGRASG